MSIIPGTVCCLLCRGMVIYKEGDKSRFKAHMNNEHGAFFDIDYLLASCLLEKEQKEAVAKTVKPSGLTSSLHEENNSSEETGVTLREESMYTHEEEERGNMVLKKERLDYSVDSDLQCGSCGAQFGTQEAFQQHHRKGCKKVDLKRKNIECEHCGKCYTSKQSLRAHKEKKHNMHSDIKQERYDDPSMDPNQMYQHYPDASSATNEEPSFDANNHEMSMGSTENYSTSEVHGVDTFDATNETYAAPNNELNMSREEDLDQIMNDVRKQNEDVMQDTAEDSFTNEENGKASNAASERFYCQVESCDKSYTAKTNKQSHEKKAHNIMSARSKTKKFKSVVEESQTENVLDGQEKETNLRWDELEKIRAQYYDNTAPKTNEIRDDDTSIEDGFNSKLEEPLLSSISTDMSIDFNEVSSEDQVTNQPTENAADELDISRSKYFTSNPKVLTSARGKSISLFNEIPFGLSEKWKMRTFEATTKTGAKSMIKHYLTPEFKVLKTGLAVVEYLRLKGEMGTEQILEISKVLNIPEAKLKSLYE